MTATAPTGESVVLSVLEEFRAVGFEPAHAEYQGAKDAATLLLVVRRFSAAEAASLLEAVASVLRGMPLGPLTGEDWEWERVDASLERNRRCPRVVRERGVGAYDTEATVFVDEDGVCYTVQPQSRRFVSFPYRPCQSYVRVEGKAPGRRGEGTVH